MSECCELTTLQHNTNVSETIRKPPLVEAQNAVGTQNNTAKDDF